MTLDEIVATLPDDAPVPAVVVRDYLRALREQHEREIDDAVRRTWTLRDFADVRHDPEVAIN